MEVVDHLAAMSARVNDDLIATLVDSLLFCKKFRTKKKPPEERSVIWRCFGKRNDMALWHDQQVRRRFWVDITNHNELAVFEDHVTRLPLCGDRAKETVRHDRFDSMVAEEPEGVNRHSP